VSSPSATIVKCPAWEQITCIVLGWTKGDAVATPMDTISQANMRRAMMLRWRGQFIGRVQYMRWGSHHRRRMLKSDQQRETRTIAFSTNANHRSYQSMAAPFVTRILYLVFCGRALGSPIGILKRDTAMLKKH